MEKLAQKSPNKFKYGAEQLHPEPGTWGTSSMSLLWKGPHNEAEPKSPKPWSLLIPLGFSFPSVSQICSCHRPLQWLLASHQDICLPGTVRPDPSLAGLTPTTVGTGELSTSFWKWRLLPPLHGTLE